MYRILFMPTIQKFLTYVQQQNIAIANGGILFGRGLATTCSATIFRSIYNDSIYPIIIEEYGLFGGAVIIFCISFSFPLHKNFQTLSIRLWCISRSGTSFTLVIQAVANMAVGVNLIPVTGVTLPLVSMGGSSFLFTCASILLYSVLQKKPGTDGREGTRSCTGDKRTCSSVIF